MINELYELSKALEHHRLLQSTTNPNISNIGKADCLLFELDNYGVPQDIRVIAKADTAALWKHSKGNHNSFPAIRVQKPLMAISECEKINADEWSKAKLSRKIDMLLELDYTAVNADCTGIKISGWSINELSPVLTSAAPELAALKQILQSFPRTESQQCSFIQNILTFLHDYIETCNQETHINLIKKLLIGDKDKKSGKYSSGCMTYYDVYDIDEFENTVASPETQRALTELLNSCESRNLSNEGSGIISPLSGAVTDGIGDKYPNPNMPVLGLTYLYSKKSDTPCLNRYDMTGAQAFQAGKAEINAVNDAISFLTSESRKNKTWCTMIDPNRDKPNLLLAYLADDPQNDAYLAEVLGSFADSEETEKRFENLCKQVLGCIEDAMSEKALRKNKQTKINLILLETLDPGRKQVVYESAITAEQLQENLLSWNDASHNCPPVEIRVRNKKECISFKPICPGPGDICRLLKMHYTYSGKFDYIKQSRVTLHEIYQIYMPPHPTEKSQSELARHMLETVLENSRDFLGDIGNQIALEYSLPPGSASQNRVKQAMSFVSLISILLYILGIRKEDYMLDTAFNVGQFLKLADILHKEYCIRVRNGGDKRKPLPAQLMGNEMLNIACKNPVEALNRLSERMRIYVAWATKAAQSDIPSNRPKWILHVFEEISLKIAANELPEHFDSAQQAQVLLGYLSEIQYKKESDTNKSDTEEETTNE